MSTIASADARGPLILTIDIGTSAARSALFDSAGRSVAGIEARRPFEIRVTADGGSEIDPDGLLEIAWQCVDDILAQAGRLTEGIAGVAVCTFVGNILGLDRRHRVRVPLMTYADTRADGEVKGLRAEFDAAAVHGRTGCHFHSSYLPARFRWLHRTDPALFEAVTHWMSLGEYLELKLFGTTAVSCSVAAWSGLLNHHRLDWDEDLVNALPVSMESLSPITVTQTPRRGLVPEFARRWPVLRRVPWFPALGDGAAANIGSGCIAPDSVALTMGTTTALRAVVDGPVVQVPDGLWCYRVDGGRALPGGALSEGGSVYFWMRDTLQLGTPEAVERDLARMAPDDHGLTVLPFFAGERAPGWAGHARATLHGLSLASTPLQILRAGMEAVAFRAAMVFDLLSGMLPARPRIVAGGGALLASPTWLQIVTDVIGRPVAVSAVKEVSSRGIALLAMEALGVLELKAAPTFHAGVYQPDPARHDRYRYAMERQQRLYELLISC